MTARQPTGCEHTTRERAWLHAFRTGLVLVLVVVAGVSCERGAVVRDIPGTEQVAGNAFNISVSPDERWLAFVEWKFPRKIVRRKVPGDEFDRRVTSVDLRTGARTEHGVESLDATLLGLSEEDRGWKFTAGFRMIKERFRPPGWRDGRYYFQPYSGGVYVAFDPGKPGVEVVSPPDAPGSCSDCPPMTWVRFRDHSWDLMSNEVSVVVRDGAVRAVYYRGEGPYRTNMILRLRTEGAEAVIVERAEKMGTMMSIYRLRVSPDERYLAYDVNSKKQAFFAGPRSELVIKELGTGREKKIATYGYMGNLIWSPDSRRLYFAGGEYDSDCAVRVVDVAATFAR